jgi:hypothetical protein
MEEGLHPTSDSDEGIVRTLVLNAHGDGFVVIETGVTASKRRGHRGQDKDRKEQQESSGFHSVRVRAKAKDRFVIFEDRNLR